MIKLHIEALCALSTVMILTGVATAFEISAVNPSGWVQKNPDVDDGRIVWQEYVEYQGTWDWDIYGVDLLDDTAPIPILVAAYAGNQENPTIWSNFVAWQDDELGNWDIWLTDIIDPDNPVPYGLGAFANDQTNPSIHGSTIVWQDEYTMDDWDIYAADITDPNNALVYVVDDLVYNQTNPNVYRSTIIYQDDYYNHWDIISADVWVKNVPEYQTVISDESEPGLNQIRPVIWGDIVVYEQHTAEGDIDLYARDISRADSEPFLIAGGAGLQQSPDISNHLVVWQDSRNGNFDIYGYNLITQKEFRITTNTANQTNPAVSGNLVVWEDARVTPTNIYYRWLDGDNVADCTTPLIGDISGDCRVNLVDFTLMAEQWLLCGLLPSSSCDS